MCEKMGVLRLVICYIVCATVIMLGAGNLFSNKNVKPAQNQIAYFSADSVLSQKEEQVSSKEEKPQETPKEQNLNTNSSSVSASADAIKGKIIERYISPYTAPQKYNNVYMKNSTGVNVDIKSLLKSPLKYKIKKTDEPQVLIVHTHATESFMKTDSDYYTDDFQSRTTNNKENMVQIGNLVSEKISKKGIKVVHDTTKHDYPEYTGSYGRSANTVKSYLKKYPSIKVVLDLHRDAVSSGDDKVKLVTEINAKKAAQVMLVMGSETGSVTNHPNWKENLKLALRLQQILEIKYPTLARPLLLQSKKYNQNLSDGALLIEFGTDVNTLEEAYYSAQLVGEAIAELLNSLQ